MKRQNRKEQSPAAHFERIMKTMEVPSLRSTGTMVNARWFLRNGAIQNRRHPKLDDAIEVAKRLAS